MMGRQAVPAQLFYDFSIEEHVPEDHLLRRIDPFLDFEEMRTRLRPFYSRIGRPSIDPELLIRMLIVGYVMGIRSERRLCEEVHLNLAYRWFCRLGLDGRVPDHSTFSLNRHGRFRQSDVLRHVFEATVETCIAEGLVGGQTFAADASMIEAEANRERSMAGADWEARPVPDDAPRAVREYLATLDDAAFGGASPVKPRFVSPSDPAAQWTAVYRRRAIFAYADNYLIDTLHAVIMDTEASRAIRQAEVGTTQMMIDRTAARFGLTPANLVADTAYGSAENLAWLVNDRGIAPHIPVIDKSERTDGTLSRADFTWDGENDRYICPRGKALVQFRRSYATPRTGVTAEGMRLYRASQRDCGTCPLKPGCCPNTPARKIPRSLHEDARDVARRITASPAYETTRRERKKVEMLFAHLKRILKLGRLRLRGPCGARDEFLLAAAAQNLRKLAKLRPPTARSPAHA